MANDILGKPEAFLDVFNRKPDKDKLNTTYCPGCGHGILHKLIAEAIGDFGIIDKTIIVAPVGCAVFMYYYYKSCGVQAAHGRAPAVATGVSRSQPESIVISYQGDGDLAAIGGNNILQAANRGENVAVIFVNNAIYGMTGGQMAPTSLLDMKTTTSPHGRSALNDGYPMRMCEIINTLDAPVYIARTSLAGTKEIMQTRTAIRKALQAQIDKKGFTFVEVLSPCPEQWKVDPAKANDWIQEHMYPIFERKVFRDRLEEAPSSKRSLRSVSTEELYQIMGAGEDEPAKPDTVKRPARPEVSYRFAGFGGQGVLKLGVVVAQAGMTAGYQVSWLPSYGPEMRGGTANSCAVLSDKAVGSPLVAEPHVLVAMNGPSLAKFLPTVRKGGMILYNSSIVSNPPAAPEGVKMVGVPALDLAQEAGDGRSANMVMLGAYNALAGMFEPAELDRTVRAQFPKAVDVNLRALSAGSEYIRKNA